MIAAQPNRLLLTLFAAALFAACGDSGTTPPVPGPLLLSLATPAADDGAVLLTVTGPGVTSVQPTSSSQRVFWRLVSADEVRAIVTGPISAGPLLTVNVADVNRAGSYSVTVTEVAARNDELRTSLAGYSAALSRVQ